MGDWGIAVVGERIRCRGGSNLKGTEGCGSAGVRRELARRQSCGMFHFAISNTLELAFER